MKIIFDKEVLVNLTQNEKKLGFVPTMGALHLGHISLIKKSIRQCNKTIVSIFVNKPQFNKKSDYINYPRLLNKDILLLKKLKVDFLFIPKFKQIYPSGANKKIKISSFSKKLCGKNRPGHFEAVVDVIERFIKIINPRKIYFGKKDMQQLKILESFINKKYSKIDVIGCKTIRNKNGLALSSRNFLLTSKQKIIASKVYKIIKKNKNKLIFGKFSIKNIEKKILKLGISKIDYIKILNINKVTMPYKKKSNFRIFIAFYLSNVRLIDNI